MLSHNIIVCRLTNHQKPGAYQPSIIGWSPVEGCFFFLPWSPIMAKQLCSSDGPGDSLSRTGRGPDCLHPMAVGARNFLGGHKDEVG